MSIRIIYSKYAVLLLLLLVIAVPTSSYAEKLPEPGIGTTAPAFNLKNLQDDNLALTDLIGKFVVIHFATSW